MVESVKCWGIYDDAGFLSIVGIGVEPEQAWAKFIYEYAGGLTRQDWEKDGYTCREIEIHVAGTSGESVGDGGDVGERRERLSSH